MSGLAASGLDREKKRLIASEQDPEQRHHWWQSLTGIAPEQLVFVDESGANVTLTPRCGRAPRGQRCLGRVPRNWGQNTTLLAAMDAQGMLAALVVEGAGDRLVFETFVAHLLAPALQPGQVVVWDNLSVHKSQRARELIEARGCSLRFLPPYSPDFNPIEQAFSKLKAYLRRAGERTREQLWEAIGAGLATITTSDCQGWYRHCGYHLTGQSL